MNVEGGISLSFMLQFLRKNPWVFLMAAAFLELQLSVCLMTGLLFLLGGLW